MNPPEDQDHSKCTTQNLEMRKLKTRTTRNFRNLMSHFKGGVHISRLPKEYEDLYGTPIPYKELGYCKLSDFLKDMPKIIRLQKGKQPGSVYIAVPVRKTTSKASNLASQQKTSVKRSLESIQSVMSSLASIISIPQAAVSKRKPELPSFSQAASNETAPSNELNLSKLVCKPTLNSFPKIKCSIASAELNSLLLMNMLLYGDDSFVGILKRGILAFDGFSFSEDSDEWKQKELLLSMLPVDTLKECLKLLSIECNSNNKHVLLHRTMEFLSSPDKRVSCML